MSIGRTYHRNAFLKTASGRELRSMDINRTMTDIFDFFARNIGDMWKKDSAPPPDVSGMDLSRSITESDIASPEAFYACPGDVPEVKFTGTQRLPLLDIVRGKFESPVEPVHDCNRNVYFQHYRLRNGKPGRPVVVMINGLYVDTNFYFDWWCWRFAAWGMDSVLITMPYAFERVPENSYGGQMTMLPDTMWTLMVHRQAFMDLHMLVNWLKSEGFGPVGTFGVSYGALMSGIYICQADNADFTIMGMPPVDFVEVLGGWDFADKLRERESRGEVTMLTDPRVAKIFNMCDMTPRVPLRNIFIGEGLFDHLVTPASIERTAEKWGGLPWLKKYPTGHINTFVFNLRFIADARKFVHSEIV